MALNGSADLVVVKLDRDLERILAVRTLGGLGEDRAVIGGISKDGRILLAGQATREFPTTEDAIQVESQGGTAEVRAIEVQRID